MRVANVAGAAIALGCLVVGVWAQQPTFKRTVLQQLDISVPGREAVTAVAEFQPGATSRRHTHPGEEIGYILEGQLLVEQEGSVRPRRRFIPGRRFSSRPARCTTPRTADPQRPASWPRTWLKRESLWQRPQSRPDLVRSGPRTVIVRRGASVSEPASC